MAPFSVSSIIQVSQTDLKKHCAQHLFSQNPHCSCLSDSTSFEVAELWTSFQIILGSQWPPETSNMPDQLYGDILRGSKQLPATSIVYQNDVTLFWSEAQMFCGLQTWG